MRSSSLVLKAALATVAFYASHASAQEPSFFAGESTASEIDAPTTESAPPYDNEEGPQTGVDSSSTNAAPPYDGPVTSSPVTGAPPYDGSSVFSTGSVTSQTLSTVPSATITPLSPDCPGANNSTFLVSGIEPYIITCDQAYDSDIDSTESCESFGECLSRCEGKRGCRAVGYTGGKGPGDCNFHTESGRLIVSRGTNCGVRRNGPAPNPPMYTASSSSVLGTGSGPIISTAYVTPVPSGNASVSIPDAYTSIVESSVAASLSSSASASASSESSAVLSALSSVLTSVSSNSPVLVTSTSSAVSPPAPTDCATSYEGTSEFQIQDLSTLQTVAGYDNADWTLVESVLKQSGQIGFIAFNGSLVFDGDTAPISALFEEGFCLASNGTLLLNRSSSFNACGGMIYYQQVPDNVQCTPCRIQIVRRQVSSSTVLSADSSVTSTLLPPPYTNEPSSGTTSSSAVSASTSASFPADYGGSSTSVSVSTSVSPTASIPESTAQSSDAMSVSSSTSFSVSSGVTSTSIVPISSGSDSVSVSSGTSITSTATSRTTNLPPATAPPCPTSTTSVCGGSTTEAEVCSSSGGSTYSYSCGRSYVGRIVLVQRAPDLGGCQSQCDSNETCVAVNYEGTTCTLFAEVTGQAYEEGVVSSVVVSYGEPYCPEYQGMSYANASSGTTYSIACGACYSASDFGEAFFATAFSECLPQCDASSQCVGVQYDTAQSQCTLKSAFAPTPYSSTACIVGRKVGMIESSTVTPESTVSPTSTASSFAVISGSTYPITPSSTATSESVLVPSNSDPTTTRTTAFSGSISSTPLPTTSSGGSSISTVIYSVCPTVISGTGYVTVTTTATVTSCGPESTCQAPASSMLAVDPTMILAW